VNPLGPTGFITLAFFLSTAIAPPSAGESQGRTSRRSIGNDHASRNLAKNRRFIRGTCGKPGVNALPTVTPVEVGFSFGCVVGESEF